MPGHRIFKLSTPQGWEASKDSLSGRFLASEEPPFGLSWEDLTEEMIFVASSRCSLGIDLGWYPDYSPEGQFRIEVVDLNNCAETYAHPLREFATRSVWAAKQKMEDWMEELPRIYAEPDAPPKEEADGRNRRSEELLPLLYQELRRLAASLLARERPGQTLQATALVHEAWLRVQGDTSQRWESRRHFFAAAGEAMRRILVDAARRKKRLKHGGGLERMEVDAVDLPAPMPDDELLALDEALTQLAQINPEAAELVKLCFFVRLTQEQAAKELGVSVSTAERRWAYARAWLFRALRQGLPPIT